MSYAPLARDASNDVLGWTTGIIFIFSNTIILIGFSLSVKKIHSNIDLVMGIHLVTFGWVKLTYKHVFHILTGLCLHVELKEKINLHLRRGDTHQCISVVHTYYSQMANFT